MMFDNVKALLAFCASHEESFLSCEPILSEYKNSSIDKNHIFLKQT